MASFGEPRVLRSFGVHVAGQAGSAAALLLLFVVGCSSVGEAPRSIRVLGNAVLAVGCAGFGGTVVLLCELVRGSQAALLEASTAAGASLVAGLPLGAGIALRAERHEKVTQVITEQIFTTILVGWSCTVAVRVWSGELLESCVLAGVCLLGAVVMWMASSPQAAMIRANT